MLKQARFIELLQKEEQRGVCWRLRLGAVPVWPLIRICAYLNWRGKKGAFSDIPDSNLKFCPDNLPAICQTNLDDVDTKKILYIARPDGLTDKVDGLPFDRFISSMAILTRCVFDVTVATANPSLTRFDEITDFSGLAVSIDASKLDIKRGEAEILTAFLKNFSRRLGFSIEYNQVTNAYIQLSLGKMCWEKVISELSPDLVISTCFYVPDVMGACAATFQNEIKFVDIQHGRVGLNHPAMAYWNFQHADPSALSLFPAEFWCWEKHNVKQINDTWSGQPNLPIPREFGNPWRYVREQKIIDVTDSPEEKYQKVGKTILIGLQPIENSLPAFFIEALKSFTCLRIWIRPHPHQRYQKETIRATLQAMGLINFSIRDDKDLYHEFSSIDVLVTAFSTVATEAKESNIPVILTHENAPVAFGDEIDNEKIFYCQDEKSSREILEKLLRKKRHVGSTVNHKIEKMLRCF